MLTASEAHPAIHHSLLHNLPQTILTLDIHISTPYKYQRPVLLHVKAGSKGESQLEGLRRGLSGVKSFLVNVLDVDLLGSLLEGFGTAYEPTPSSSLLPEAESNKGQGYSSPALQSLTLLGPHDLTDPNITRTVSHSPSIHTLKLYPRSSRPIPRFTVAPPASTDQTAPSPPTTGTTINPPASPSQATSGTGTGGGPVRTFINIDPFTPWNAVDALSNEAWFPALENLVVQLPQFEKTTPELDRIKAVCEKRGVRVRVEQAQGVTVL
ncbi:12602_t:CDS:1 [Acaulospora colombiana]|uniref:12602_t:CDS:1 n=1 Tax=Acaulospora colombiana TaxID=27376 RepID=A0ACA9LFK9_9GLOM|nr:12602_t:CDS:1 [Acaulospora colombiana]